MAGHAVGLYLIAWGIFTAYMFIASLRTTAAVAAVFALLAITFIVLGIGNVGCNADVIKAGGYIGIATAVVAWYASFAVVPTRPSGGRSCPWCRWAQRPRRRPDVIMRRRWRGSHPAPPPLRLRALKTERERNCHG